MQIEPLFPGLILQKTPSLHIVVVDLCGFFGGGGLLFYTSLWGRFTEM